MRMGEGRETFNRLLNWDRGQAPSERLAAIILSKEGFKGVDPSHPLGGMITCSILSCPNTTLAYLPFLSGTTRRRIRN